ncbi:anti-sigma factor (plasmid) [Paroceanicella profunda]|uniref:Anti-sigma factor n=1 Tax=Paroceanicella profunda TaxID=2579971 RepID=A0A5B8G2N3_9RHOB|nr:anti-sigma factor [Paroceanicella profunda]QDL94344.1 anti-sigma factor [Paroceanicella profunda]
MTRHPICDDDLHGYVDGALTPERAAEVEAWLAVHPHEAARVADYADQARALRAALDPVAEQPVPAQLHLGRLIEARGRRRGQWRQAAAAVLLLGLGGAGGWLSHAQMPQGPLTGIAALASESAQSYGVYATDALRPVELTAAQGPVLADWAERRLGRPMRIPDLAASGWRFMGGRVVATAHGPAMMLMYDDDAGTRLVMQVRRMAGQQDPRMSGFEDAGVNGYTWSAHGMGYALAGGLPPQRLHPLADDIRRQLDTEA